MKADYPQAIWEFEKSDQMFAIIAQNITRCNLNTGVFRIPLNI